MEQLQSHICGRASSYMGKYLRISSYMRKPFLKNDFATAPLWIFFYMSNIWFSFFLSVYGSESGISGPHLYKLDCTQKFNITKKFMRPLAIDIEFFIAYLPILGQCKTKGAVRAVCAFLRIWPLGAYIKWPITDGAVYLKGPSQDGGGTEFSKKATAPLSLITTYRMSLISVGSISLDSGQSLLAAHV